MRPHLTQHSTQQPLDRSVPRYVSVLVTPAVIEAVTSRLEDRTSALELTFTPRAQRVD